MRKSKILQALLISLLLGLTTVTLADRFAGKSYHATYEECRDSFIEFHPSTPKNSEIYIQTMAICRSVIKGWPFASSIEYTDGTKKNIKYDPSYSFCYGECATWTGVLILPQIIYNAIILTIIYFCLAFAVLVLIKRRSRIQS